MAGRKARRLRVLPAILAPLLCWALPVPAQQAVPAKAQACVACHGPAGNSPTTIVPSLAGQPKQFLVTQLFLFREGNRKDQQMTPIAASLTNADMNELAAYFTAQKAERKGGPLAADRQQAAQQLASSNHCNSCHGPQLMGQQHIPRLAGQHSDYLKIQLRGFKASTRFDMDGQMTSAAQALSAADIDLLADYLASLGPQ